MALGQLRELLDFFHHGGPGVRRRHHQREAAVPGEHRSRLAGLGPGGPDHERRPARETPSSGWPAAGCKTRARRGNGGGRLGQGLPPGLGPSPLEDAAKLSPVAPLQAEQQLVDCAQAFNNHGCQGYVPTRPTRGCRGHCITETDRQTHANSPSCPFPAPHPSQPFSPHEWPWPGRLRESED